MKRPGGLHLMKTAIIALALTLMAGCAIVPVEPEMVPTINPPTRLMVPTVNNNLTGPMLLTVHHRLCSSRLPM
jgi:hypothetical protein